MRLSISCLRVDAGSPEPFKDVSIMKQLALIAMAFNHDFDDADIARILHSASLAGDLHRYFTCGWVTGRNICSSLVQGPSFPEHLHSQHGIVGPDKAPVKCCWVSCFTDMKKESLTRHVNEKHLEVRYQCPSCPEQFTRPFALQQHIAKKHQE